MSPVSRGRTSKKQKKAQKSRQRPARAAVQREDTQSADLLPASSQPGQPSSGFRALSALVDQFAGPRERPAWFGPSIGRMLRQQAPVIAATGPRELEQAVAELAGAEVYWALNEARRGLWFEWWFEELARLINDDPPDIEGIVASARSFGTEMDFDSLPELMERHGLHFPA